MSLWKKLRGKVEAPAKAEATGEADAAGHCSHLDSCPLFTILRNHTVSNAWRTRYCEEPEEHKNCERFKVSSAGGRVPLTLLPNGKILGGK